ncbi:GNAT family N-acetyltransferase [Nostocoides sp. F2B08]|uniref:GNAT family N-acetyltransferase n=1 Tax=Nostocoides sp. F2B08 TaxID=2653936 RepID=UPI001D057758
MIIELVPPNTGPGLRCDACAPPSIGRPRRLRTTGGSATAPLRLPPHRVAARPRGLGRGCRRVPFRREPRLGRHLYIDDLSTLPSARKQGNARLLLEWLHDEAGRLQCQQIHLDSGVGPDRTAAHRRYLNAGFRISSHHFAREL